MSSRTSALTELVSRMCFELVPMKSVEAAIAELAPGSSVSVTCSPAKGLAATQELVARLLDLGHDAVPHLAARQVEDRRARDAPRRLDPRVRSARGVRDRRRRAQSRPARTRTRCRSSAICSSTTPAWPASASPPIPTGTRSSTAPRLHDALHAKQALFAAAGVGGSATTQMCFDAARIRTWLSVERCDGLTMPVVVGIPGVVDRGRLLKMGVRIGVGASLRYLRKNRAAMAALLAPGGYDPTDLVRAVASDAASLGVTGLHSYTFNSVAATRAWQQALLAPDVAGRV